MTPRKFVIPAEGGSRSDSGSKSGRPPAQSRSSRKFVVPDPGAAPDRVKASRPEARPARSSKKIHVSPGDAPPPNQGGRNDKGIDPPTGPKKTGRGRRKVLRRVLQVAGGLLALLLLYYAVVAYRTNAAVRHTKPDVLSVLSHDPGPTNILMVGSDTREGANSVIPGESKAGLADVIMLVQLRGTSARILSIPRDTKVRLSGYGEQKINASLPLGGPPMAVEAVKSLTGLPIHRFAEIDFEGFMRVTDAVGGVEICPEFAERDEFSGLNIPAGCQTVHGEQALAFVRSRHTEILRNGKWTADGSGDLGRIERQQMFLGALARKMKNPVTLTADAWWLGPAAGSAVITDPGFGPFDGSRAAIALVGGSDSMELLSLPTVPASSRGIAFLEVKQPEAGEVLAHFRQS